GAGINFLALAARAAPGYSTSMISIRLILTVPAARDASGATLPTGVAGRRGLLVGLKYSSVKVAARAATSPPISPSTRLSGTLGLVALKGARAGSAT